MGKEGKERIGGKELRGREEPMAEGGRIGKE